tara:strand:- start:847 stop:1062 length:216 start_codon:yes stop_codon:yes gene_type:complete
MDAEAYNQQKVIENLSKERGEAYWYTLDDMRVEERERLLRNLWHISNYFTLTPEQERVSRDIRLLNQKGDE